MNVLSLFDGMSCGQIALQRAGITVDNYFASEIDKYAIKITQKNFPNTIQLGDVNNWIEWNLPKIDLLIGGSPCQGFSNAGAGLNFADPRSTLFFKFVDCLRWYEPTYFLLENVKMKKEWQEIITSYLGVKPTLINSALVSAQNRQRLYWTNVPDVTQPEDKHIYLKDVIEHGEVDREKSYCIDANYFKGGSVKMYKEKARRQIVNLPTQIHQSERRLMVQESEEPILLHNIYGGFKESKPRIFTGKSPTIRTSAGGGHIPSVVTEAAIRNQVTPRGIEEQLNIRKDNKSNCVVPSYPAKLNGMIDQLTFRMLTPLECERLQTVPEGYTEGVSNTQRYRMLGNGWTVDIVAHIFRFIPKEVK